MATAKAPAKTASAPMDKAEMDARRQAKEIKDQKAATSAYDASLTTAYKNGGMVKATRTSSPIPWGGGKTHKRG